MTPAPVRDLRETSHARESFSKTVLFLCADFLKMVFCMSPWRRQVRGPRIAKFQGVGVGLKTKLPRLLGTVGTD